MMQHIIENLETFFNELDKFHVMLLPVLTFFLFKLYKYIIFLFENWLYDEEPSTDLGDFEIILCFCGRAIFLLQLIIVIITSLVYFIVCVKEKINGRH